MDYPVKTLHQLRPLLVGFRKAAGLTQAQVAAHLGVTQQTYAQLEAKPESASLDRLFHVLKMLGVNIVLTDVSGPAKMKGGPWVLKKAEAATTAKQSAARKRVPAAVKVPAAGGGKSGTSAASVRPRNSQKPAAVKAAASIGPVTRKREDW